jgi:hypothetical protein
MIERTPEEARELQRRLTGYQQRYDEVLEPLKRSAPPPKLNQGANAYRREALGYIQLFLPRGHELRDLSLANCRADALGALEPQILALARETARRPALLADTPAGRVDSLNPNIRAVTLNGITTFHGESFVKAMGRPGRRVASFMPISWS